MKNLPFASRVVSLIFVTGLIVQPASKAGELDIRTDVHPSTVPQEMMLVEHDFQPGDSSGWHIHHGDELAYVLAGTFELRIAGAQTRLVSAGDSFRILRDTPHEVRNVGKETGKLIISYLMDKSVPWKILVAAPGGDTSSPKPNQSSQPPQPLGPRG